MIKSKMEDVFFFKRPPDWIPLSLKLYLAEERFCFLFIC
jgi:hypothetical protein